LSPSGWGSLFANYSGMARPLLIEIIVSIKSISKRP
jgi:hypothetical protein